MRTDTDVKAYTRRERHGARLWKFAVGVAFCMNPILAVAVVGWTYRVMQRHAVRCWLRRARPGSDIESYALLYDDLRHLARLPNFVLRQPGAPTRSGGRIRAGFGRLFGSLGLNLKIGAQGLANTWVLLLPAEVFWLFGWYSGWDVSFNKVYEQFSVGRSIALTGIVLFCLAMMYVPWAQARQAITGEWRAFYDFRLVWRMARRHWALSLLLATAYAVFALAIVAQPIVLIAYGNSLTGIATLTDAEIIRQLNRIFLLFTAVGFPSYVALRLLATRAYCRAIVEDVRKGEVGVESLARFERRQLKRMGFAAAGASKRQPMILVRAPRRLLRASVAVATFLIWFAFVAQIYVSAFLVYQSARGWLNQPLVQAPWYKSIPEHLRDGEVAYAHESSRSATFAR
jgi:nitrate reductase NapE component